MYLTYFVDLKITLKKLTNYINIKSSCIFVKINVEIKLSILIPIFYIVPRIYFILEKIKNLDLINNIDKEIIIVSDCSNENT
jgi:hypothetical protein